MPVECADWIAGLLPDARAGLVHTALYKYMPAILRGHPEARDGILSAFITRQCASGGGRSAALTRAHNPPTLLPALRLSP